MAQVFPPIDELIPHSGPMILLDELLHWAEGEATARLCIRDRSPFVENGRVDCTVTIEYMAQAVAACLGYEALRGGAGVRVGMIIACKRFVAHGSALHVDDALVIDVKRVRGNEMLSHFDCRVRVLAREEEQAPAESLFSEATLTLYHADKPPDEAS